MVHEAAPLAVDGGGNAAAAVVADDHDVLHLQHIDGELKHRQVVGILRRREIGDVAVHEEFARIKVHDLVGWNPAIGAADPQVLGRLLPFQALEKTRVGGNLALGPGPVACFQMVQHASRIAPTASRHKAAR